VVSQLKTRGHPAQFAPDVFAIELTDWIQYGVAPDNELLHAILRNDLAGTIALTSHSSWHLVHATLVWLWNFAPPGSFGSRHLIHCWEQAGGREGQR
jgi:hypothetical protein